jgi:hypothetical protein
MSKKHPLTHNPTALIPCTPDEEEKKEKPSSPQPGNPGKKEIKNPKGGVG